MKRFFPVFTVLMVYATAAYAGVFGSVKDWVSGELIGAVLGGAALIISVFLKRNMKEQENAIKKVSRTSTEVGELFIAIGNATSDPNVTKEELAAIFKEGADVVNLFRKTPPKYQTGQGNPEPPRAIMIP